MMPTNEQVYKDCCEEAMADAAYEEAALKKYKEAEDALIGD